MLGGAHLPAGMPGTITWRAKQVGIPAFNLAYAAYNTPGKEGRQARFYLAMVNHQRMRHAALAAAAANQQPTA